MWQILGCIEIDKFCWYNIEEQSEVWSDSQGGEFFNSNYLDGENSSMRIHNDHYIVFLKLQAYFEKGRFNSIHTYDEFLESDCQLIILIYDCEFVELYLKDQDYIRKIYENAIKITSKIFSILLNPMMVVQRWIYYSLVDSTE